MSLRQLLKAGTGELHREVEETPPMKKLFQKDYSKADYQQYLERQYQVFFPLEKKLQSVPELDTFIPQLSQRWKSPSLQKDLKSNHAPKEINFPFSSLNLSQALGVLYVLEGSSLGSQLIHRKLSAHFENEVVSFHFLNHYGDSLGQFWKGFVSVLDSAEITEKVNAEEALQTAQATFTMMIEAFRG